MKPKFTPEQLNRLNLEAMEMMGFTVSKSVRGTRFDWYYLDDEAIMYVKDWNPCDKNSAQAQNYLIPRLLACKLYITTNQDRPSNFTIRVWDDLKASFESDYSHLISFKSTGNPDEINATITECCLEAMKKLKEKS